MKSSSLLLATAGLMAACAQAQTSVAVDAAAAFGAQPAALDMKLSPDGHRLVYIAPGPQSSNVVMVVDIATGKVTPIARANGQPMRLTSCNWASSTRLVCHEQGEVRDVSDRGEPLTYTRLYALDIDGKNVVSLGVSDTDRQLYSRQFDGQVIDWLSGTDGTLLMTRYYVPDMSTGTRLAQTDEGYGVDRIDTRTKRIESIERPKPNVFYISDGRGNVRLMSRQWETNGLLTGKVTYYYRTAEDKTWRDLGTNDPDAAFEPLAVDSGVDAAYVLKTLDGRKALYRIALDGSLNTDLVFAQPQVDIEDVVTIGRSGRVIGAAYATDVPRIEYFDPDYKRLAASLAHALPSRPIIEFVSASADEQQLVIFASGDNDPGCYYLFDRKTHQLSEITLARPALEKTTLAHVQPISYPAADGTAVPAYLTLPPGVGKPQDLPTIVMPHGGPAARDVWGFNWLAQFYANRGFAVLQPNYRGSAGYGNDWFVKNGFKSWQVAIGDIIDGARWLVSQGIADPAKLAIVGWSYGGYAALQANVMAPDLFKAVVATAPVTDLGMLKNEAIGFTDERMQRDYIGSGPYIEAGSPARHADAFKAPVLMFHGESDGTVAIGESQAMDKALKKAGKSSELITYPQLDHQLYADDARADMLRRSYEFLRTTLKL